MLIANYPQSEHAKDARDKLVVAYDQLAGKEMSVGRWYLNHAQPLAGADGVREPVHDVRAVRVVPEGDPGARGGSCV